MAYADLDKKWTKPSLIIFCESEPLNSGTTWELGTNYLYITDDGRSPVQINTERIEYKQRMINGRLRSYHVADKRTFSTSWENLPSRNREGNTDADRKYISEYEKRTTSINYGAGQQIKDWYDAHPGDFWMLLVYDADFVAGNSSQAEKYRVFFESFNYDIVKRGQYNDLWDMSISLVEA